MLIAVELMDALLPSIQISSVVACSTNQRTTVMRSAIPIIVFAMWWLYPFTAGACGLSGPWYVSSDDGYTGIFVVEKAIDDLTSDARLSVFSPVGDSAVEACRGLRSENIVIYCEVISTTFFWQPDNFILEDHGDVLKGQWSSDITGNVVFTKQ